MVSLAAYNNATDTAGWNSGELATQLGPTGVTSGIAVPAYAGIPVTHRGVAHEFTVISGHIPPEHPDSLVNWPAAAQMQGTLVLLMAVTGVIYTGVATPTRTNTAIVTTPTRTRTNTTGGRSAPL